MIIGLLMLFVPIAIYIATFPVARRLRPGLCRLYRIIGGIIVFGGSVISVYFAAYTGDQGGIAAFYFQIVVILVYVLFSVALMSANWFIQKTGTEKA
jgi:hypothetical protein